MLSFVQGLLIFVFVQFVLVLALSRFNVGPRIKGKEDSFARYLNWAIMLLLVPYALLTIYCALSGTVPTFWPFFQALLIEAVVLASLVGRSSSSTVVALALLIPVVVMLMSLLINGSMPMGQDEGRFAGFAYRIMLDGRWQPNFYAENTYYQFFNVVPCIIAALSVVTGLDILHFVHPLIMLVVTLVVSLEIYVILKNTRRGMLETKSARAIAILGPILLFLTPPIGSPSFIPQTLAIVLYLTALMLLSIKTAANFNSAKFMVLFLISAIGIVTHATYPILLLSTLIPMLLSFSKNKNRAFESHFLKSIIFAVSIFTLAYWTYTLILNALVGSGESWVLSLIDLLTGQASPFAVGRPVWYSAAPFPLAYSWVLVIALAGACIFAQMPKETINLKKTRGALGQLIRDWPVTVATTGILWLGIALLLRAAPGGGATRYFYPFYVLLIPASAIIVSKIADKKRVINTTIIVVVIAIGSFYSLQEYMYVTGDVLMVANRRTWIVAESLAQHVSLETRYILYQRVEIPFCALTMKSAPALYYSSPNKSYNGTLIVVDFDRLGEQWVSGWIESNVLQGIVNNSYDIVYTDGMYRALYIAREKE